MTTIPDICMQYTSVFTTLKLELAVWVSWSTYKNGFDLNIWALYGAFAVGHAGYDKTMAVVAQLKNKRMDNDAANTTP